jgi:homoserine kinase
LTPEVVSQAFCSTANLGAGFDAFGLALKKYSDEVHARFTSGKRLVIRVKGRYSTNVPPYVRSNSAGPPAVELSKRANLKRGLEIIIEKNVPQGLGLGSSGATAAACTKALDYLLGLELSNNELVRVASLGEKAVSGSAHADNVAASLLGGFVVVYDDPVKTISIQPPKNLAIVVVIPQLQHRENKTRLARTLIPKNVSVHKAVLNIGRASAISAGFATGEIETIGSGMLDEIAEPNRQHLIPGYPEAREAGLHAHAAGVAISGAGPSVIALVDQKRNEPRSVAKAMASAFARNGIRSEAFISTPAPAARIIER